MSKNNEKYFGLRTDRDILAKFRYVSEYESRSANSQIIQFITEYEKKHGKIELETND